MVDKCRYVNDFKSHLVNYPNICIIIRKVIHANISIKRTQAEKNTAYFMDKCFIILFRIKLDSAIVVNKLY